MIEIIEKHFFILHNEVFRTAGLKPKVQVNKYGYGMVGAGGKFLQFHRVVFCLAYGYLPAEVDHIDGNPSNNHPDNLRACTRVTNSHNRRGCKNAGVKYKGVDFHKKYANYRARINGRHIGSYDTPEKAAIAYDEAAGRLFGEFAKTNKSMGLLPTYI